MLNSKKYCSSSWQIAVLSYNINGRRPTRVDVERWLSNEEGLSESQIVCISLQEVSHSEVFFNVSPENSWTDSLCSWMYNKSFVLAHRICLATNLLLIFSKQYILHLVEKIESKWCRQSVGGHKGTVSSRLSFKDDSSIVFLSSHFVHGEKNLQMRIEQYNQSVQQCSFEKNKIVDPFSTKLQLVIWLGDFNFRIDGCQDVPAILIEKLKKFTNETDVLQSYIEGLIENFDQLSKCKRRGQIFVGFTEPKITFTPTYRILLGHGAFDPLRMPSWCDRIFFKTDLRLEVMRYTSFRQITISDHFPVSAVFCLKDSPKLNKWNCIFSPVPTWAPFIPFVCRFKIDDQFWRVNGSYRDWIGVYKSGVGSIAKPIQWVYLLACYTHHSAVYPSPFFVEESTEACSSIVNQKKSSAVYSTVNSSSASLKEINNNADPNLKIFLVAEFSALLPGQYHVGYFNIKLNCLHGLSEIFIVSEPSSTP